MSEYGSKGKDIVLEGDLNGVAKEKTVLQGGVEPELVYPRCSLLRPSEAV